MAYADPLDQTTPDDAAIAGQGDDRIREFKRAIRQRLGSFFQDIDADPLVPKVGSIPQTVFPDGALNARVLTDATIAAAKFVAGIIMPNDSVRTASIKDGEVTSPKLADGAVATLKLADNAVTANKLATDSVTSDKIIAGGVGTAEVADAAITKPKLAAALQSIVSVRADGSHVAPAATTLSGAVGTADSYQVDIADPAVAGLALGPVLVQPDVSDAAATGVRHWSDGLICVGMIMGPATTRYLRIRINSTNSDDVDISARKFYWSVTQPV